MLCTAGWAHSVSLAGLLLGGGGCWLALLLPGFSCLHDWHLTTSNARLLYPGNPCRSWLRGQTGVTRRKVTTNLFAQATPHLHMNRQVRTHTHSSAARTPHRRAHTHTDTHSPAARLWPGLLLVHPHSATPSIASAAEPAWPPYLVHATHSNMHDNQLPLPLHAAHPSTCTTTSCQ